MTEPVTSESIDLRPFAHLYPFRHHTMRLGGFRCHYVDEGSGPPVLMLHGNPTWSFYFRRLILEKAGIIANKNVIPFEPRGFLGGHIFTLLIITGRPRYRAF